MSWLPEGGAHPPGAPSAGTTPDSITAEKLKPINEYVWLYPL
jgi:hypothetical protein